LLFALGEKSVAKSFAENLCEELSFECGFFLVFELSSGFKVSPFENYSVCFVLGRAPKAVVLG